MTKWLFRVSVCMGLIGMVFGITMGLTHNFRLAPVHAHLLLVGFVVMFLQALYYSTIPQAAESRLAKIQAVISIIGAVLFPIGITCILLFDRQTFLPVLAAGWITVLTGMLLFAVIVFRTSGSQVARR